ncbi:MAG: response regulator transcription factor [Gammaproteobacteria bacterium]|nr:response regulator transcription factor [Gammaproteobacteria bacterium]
MTGAPTVFVVDDEPDVREGLIMLIRSLGLAVEGYPSARNFLDSYQPWRPGCLVLDVRMPGMSGLELQEHMERWETPPPIIMISGHGEIPMAVQAIKRGALDFIPKPFSDQQLLDRIHQALKLDAERRRAMQVHRQIRRRYESLTPREREVMCEVVAGKINKVIADNLNISQRTVEIHRARAMEKMAADSLSDLVRMAAIIAEDDA